MALIGLSCSSARHGSGRISVDPRNSPFPFRSFLIGIAELVPGISNEAPPGAHRTAPAGITVTFAAAGPVAAEAGSAKTPSVHTAAAHPAYGGGRTAPPRPGSPRQEPDRWPKTPTGAAPQVVTASIMRPSSRSGDHGHDAPRRPAIASENRMTLTGPPRERPAEPLHRYRGVAVSREKNYPPDPPEYRLLPHFARTCEPVSINSPSRQTATSSARLEPIARTPSNAAAARQPVPSTRFRSWTGRIPPPPASDHRPAAFRRRPLPAVGRFTPSATSRRPDASRRPTA